jgi:hypothetical protein
MEAATRCVTEPVETSAHMAAMAGMAAATRLRVGCKQAASERGGNQ